MKAILLFILNVLTIPNIHLTHMGFSSVLQRCFQSIHSISFSFFPLFLCVCICLSVLLLVDLTTACLEWSLLPMGHQLLPSIACSYGWRTRSAESKAQIHHVCTTKSKNRNGELTASSSWERVTYYHPVLITHNSLMQNFCSAKLAQFAAKHSVPSSYSDDTEVCLCLCAYICITLQDSCI